MYRKLKVIAILAAAAGSSLPAFSQDYLPEQRLRPGQESSIQSSITIMVPLDETKGTEAQQEEALKSFYAIASRSCDVVLDTVAKACEISRITTNTRTDDTGMRVSRLTLTGQIVMKVSFKPSANKAPE
jgi:hypothetical protein